MYNWNTEQFKEELKNIVNIDSGTAYEEGVARVEDYFAKEFSALGLTIKEFDNKTRLEARTHDEEDFDVMLVGHMDTVFDQGTCAARPYTENGNLAYGPGVADMKAGLMAALYLVRKLREERPDIRVCVAFSGDEETGSERSHQWFEELAAHAKYALVLEPGRANNGFVRSRKGCMDIVAEFHGIASHAGVAPEKGASAILEMARWITELSALQNLEIGTSVSAGVVNGGTASNVIPDYAKAVFDVRVTDINEIAKIKNKVNELNSSVSVKGVTVDVRFDCEIPPMTPTPVTQQLIDKINQTAAELGMPISWVDTGGVSDANCISGAGAPVLCGCGPCGGELHSDKEYLELDTIETRLNLLYSLIISM